MLLAVDVGNTQTVFGLYDGDALGERWRIATESHRTGDELGALLGDFLDLQHLVGICLSSTVPRLIREYEHVAERWARTPLLVVGPGVKTGIQIHYGDPRGARRQCASDRDRRAVGADRAPLAHDLHSRSVPHPRGVTDRLGAEPLAASIDGNGHTLEEGLALGVRELGLEPLDDRGRARSCGEEARDHLVGRRELHELVLERPGEAAVAEGPAVELLQEAGRAPLAELPHRLADEHDQLG